MTTTASSHDLVETNEASFSNHRWQQRRLRLLKKRFGDLNVSERKVPLGPNLVTEEDRDVLDHGGDPQEVNARPAAWVLIRDLIKASTKVDPDEADFSIALAEERPRKFGLGLIGWLTRRQIDPAIRRLPHVEWQLDNMSDYRPYFTYWLTFVQVMVMILSLVAFGLGPIGVGLTHVSGLVMTEYLTMEQIEVHAPSNIWLGPASHHLVRLGATFTPCMKTDPGIEVAIANIKQEEDKFGCCVRNDGSGCVQTAAENCSPLLSSFLKWSGDQPGPGNRVSGPVCHQDPRYCANPASSGHFKWPDNITQWPLCLDNQEQFQRQALQGAPRHMTCPVLSKPCCVGIHGKCELRSQDYCEFVGGHFHPEATLCSQVSCMNDVCGMLPFDHQPNQFYRLWTSLFLHAGVVHTLLSILFQLTILRDLERLCGTTRTAMIFFSAGVMGNLASAMFTPYRQECGPSGALFGVLGALTSEVLKAWRLLKRPWKAIAHLCGFVVMLFLVGLLPFVDNYAHVFGFFTGLVVAYALLPSLELNESESKSQRYLTPALLLGFLALFAIMLATFYLVDLSGCDYCKYLNCIPFTKDFCAEMYINYDRRKRVF